MSEIIKDYSKAEIQQGIKTDMSTAMSKGKIDLRGVANNRRIKVQNNIIKIKNDLVMHGKMDRDTENKFQKFKNKYKQLCDIDLPKITKEFAFVRNVENKKTYIEQFAIKLDTYEDEVLSLLKPLVQLKNEENNFFKGNQDSQENDFISICGPNLIRFIKGQDANDKSIILNKSTNPIPIHEILQESSINEGEVRKIDYSGCTSERIKNKMVNCLGGKESCYISYCDETKTYNLFDEQGYLLSQRAYIWEGVKLFPPYLLKWEGSQNAKNAAEKTAIDNMKNISSDKEKELQGRIPERLKKQLNEAQQKEFIKYTEKILNSAVLSARKGGEQLSGEPIKLTNFDGLKLYTVTEHNRYYRDLFPNKYYKISDELNSILNKNERYVQVYLSSRVQEKWNDASTFSNTDIIDVNPTIEDEELMVENVRNFEKGIDALMGILGNYKTRVVPESFTWEAKDQFVADLETYLNNLIATIESGVVYKSLLKQAEKDISDKLKKCGFVHDGSKSIENFVNTILESGDDERQLALRSLGESSNWMRHDTSLSSDQLRNTVINKDNIKIEKEEYDVCLKNIEEYFLVGDSDIVDGDKKCINAKNIDELYGCESGKEVFDFFKNKKLIPEKGDYSDFKDVCENIFRKIQTDNNQIEKYQLEIENNSREWLNEEYNRVLAKDNKDENDISFLNKYEFLVSPKGKDILNDMIKNVLPSVVKNIKYCNAVPFLKGTLGLQLARSGGGLSKSDLNGTDLDIVKEFNDSIGAGGLFDLKDESVETNINIAKEVVKEVIICLVVMALTEGTAASLLEARRVKNLGKWGSRAVNWIVKGSLFNMYSLVINNTLDLATGRKVVTEIGEGLNIFNGRNREGYAGSVAFFAIMEMIPIGLVKVGTKIGGKYLINALVKSGKAEKEAIDILLKASNSGSIEQFMNFAFSVKEVGNLLKVIETAGVKTTAFGVELGSMLLASEVTTLMSTGGFEKISDEELAHTIAMILAFKGVGKIKSIIKGKDGKPVVEIESEKDGKIREVTADELDGWKDTFDKQIFGDGYTDPVGNTWKITYENTPSQNANRKGVWKLIKNGKVIRSVKGEPGVIPGEYSGTFPGETKGDIRGNGNNFREFYADCWAEYTKLQMDNIYKLTGEKVVDAVHDQSTGSAHVEDVVESKNNGPESKPDVSTGKNNISERGNPSEGRSKEELQRSKEENIKKQTELQQKKSDLESKKTQLEADRQANLEILRGQQISIENISEVLQEGNIITIDGLKYEFIGIKGGEAEFVIDVNAKRSAEMSGKNPKNIVKVKELSELNDPRFNLEPGAKNTNSGRKAKLDELLKTGVEKNGEIEEINKELNKINEELANIEEQLEEAKNLDKKYADEISELNKGQVDEVVINNPRPRGNPIEPKMDGKETKETKDALTHDENELLNYIVKEVETLPENTSKKYNLGNGDKIEIKKLPNGNFVEMNSVIKTDAESLTIQNPVSKEMIPSELEAYIKERIIRGRENQQRGQIDKNSVYTPTVEGQVVETIETKDVSESTNINEIVEVIQQLNPDAKIQLGNEYGQVASDYIYSSVPMDKLVLPEGFYYDKKNGITNKHKTNSGKYINFSVYDIKGVDGKRFYTKDKNNETSGRQGNEKPFVSDELGHTTNTDGINLVEGQVINTELSNLNEYISIDKNGEVKFKEGLLSNDFLGRSYITIEGKKYKVFSKGRGNGAGCMIGSREVRMGGQTLEGLTSRGSFDFKIGNFKNGELNGYGVKIGRGIKEEGNFKNGELEGKGARTGTNGSKYEGNFVNGELKKGIEISNNGGAKKIKFVGDVDLNYIKDQANILGDKLASGEIMEIEIPNGGKLTIKNNEGILVENLEGLDILIEGKLGNYIENGIKTRDKNGGYKKDLDIEAQIISESQLKTLKSLGKGWNENLYLSEFGEPKNVISLGNGEKLYVSNCLQKGNRKYIVGYVQKGGELKLRLFYRSNSEGIRRSCPGARGDGCYSKGEHIKNSCYETTTRVINELQYKFDNLSIEQINKDPIKVEGIPFNALESEMAGEIKIYKLFAGLENNTVDFFQKYNSTGIKDRYRSLGDNFDINGMNLVEGKGYTYEHQHLGTIDVEICRLNCNGKDLDFSFAKVKNDPWNRVRIEEVKYADAKITSFGIYDKQINAAPLTGKPIDYARQVPSDMQSNSRLGQSDYIDIRDLYQENPIIKKYKEIKENQNMEHKKAA